MNRIDESRIFPHIHYSLIPFQLPATSFKIPNNLQEHQITVKNINTNYKVFGQNVPAGTGKPMLILHGWGSKSDRWQKVGEVLAGKNIIAIVPDLPGFGLTPPPKTPWNLDNYVEWLREFTQQVPELSRDFYLLGHSFGGSLSVKFTVKYNQSVKKLFLISAACVRKLTFSKKFFYYLSKVFKIFSFIPGYQLGRKAFYKFILRRSDYPYVQGVMKDTYIKVVSEDLSQRLSFVKVPTTIIWGDKDTSTPISDAEFIHQKISHSQLIVIPGAKHSLQIEVPELLTEKIIEHIPVTLLDNEILISKL